jgi:hypothetical protein
MISFGSDPEFMLKKGSGYFSAIPIIQADKDNPIEKNGHKFHWDNVLAECAVKPATSKKESVENHQECFNIYSEMVAPYKLVPQASQSYNKNQLLDEGALESGCEPDVCVYTGIVMSGNLSAAEMIRTQTFRTCGGHVHLGHDILTNGGPERIFSVYLLDMFLGIPSLFIDKDPTSQARKRMYGQAGRYREKPYGVEYRSPSNFWLASPVLVELVYDISKFVVESLENQKIVSWNEDLFWENQIDGLPTGEAFFLKDFNKESFKNCIDNNDLKEAKKLFNQVKKYLPKTLLKKVEKQMNKRKPYSMYEEWNL